LTQVVTNLACIREVLGSSLGRDIAYPEVFCGFPQSFRTIAAIVPQIRPLLLPSISPAMYYVIITLYLSILLHLRVSAPSNCNVVRCSFIRHYFTTCFGLNGHLQVYRCCSSGLRCSLQCGFLSSYFYCLQKPLSDSATILQLDAT
jgi:hypothetical protein